MALYGARLYNDVEITPVDGGNRVKLLTHVGGRTYNSDNLRQRTGIEASENQAELLLSDLNYYLAKHGDVTATGQEVHQQVVVEVGAVGGVVVGVKRIVTIGADQVGVGEPGGDPDPWRDLLRCARRRRVALLHQWDNRQAKGCGPWHWRVPNTSLRDSKVGL